MEVSVGEKDIEEDNFINKDARISKALAIKRKQLLNKNNTIIICRNRKYNNMHLQKNVLSLQ